MTIASSPDHTVEGFAHVVRVEGAEAWLEPEQTTSCGGCAAAARCGSKGIGSVASRLEARRFKIDNAMHFVVGERVVVGVYDRALIKASLTAYAIPLATTLMAGVIAQSAAGRDAVTMAAMAAGLGLGLLLARLGASRLTARGELAPRVLRRAAPDETCHPKG